ncbi:unnamed protein product [Ostreobium quekettii]|uniref:RNA polymerase sigma-70 region 2 domain-containing protein n=1 Tax=Ostreobium quekettii TaxID=121088 RepID=A0A8S1IK57_9CHLO|nr:unnamed protein product [Ostreobium quekettii]
MAATDDFSSDSTGDRDLRVQFARVFATNDRWLFAYLVSLLGSPTDAEEVFQEVCVILWRDYDKFDPNTNFMKWASVIAHHQVHRFRRNQRKQAKPLSDAVVDLLADEAVAKADLMDSRRIALHDCLKKLPEADRELVRNCYSDSRHSMKTVAKLLGRPANTVYKAMNRIRRSLHGCIDRKLATERLLRGLLDAFCNGDLPSNRIARFNELLENDSLARETYLKFLAVEAEMHALHSTRSQTIAASAVVEVDDNRGANSSTSRPVSIWAIAASLIGVAVLSSVLTSAVTKPGAELLNRQVNAENPPEATTPVARISATRNCRWRELAGGSGFGAKLYPGQRLDLEAGVAEITFGSGATILLEGPASFNIDDAKAASLDSGRLSARVPDDAPLFLVRTGRIGVGRFAGGETSMPPAQAAEFGLLSDGLGGGEVHVFDGTIHAHLLSQAGDQLRSVLLNSQEAARVRPASTTVARFHANNDRFVRSLSGSSGPHGGLYAYEGFDYPVGPLSWQNGGFGWAGPWADIETNDPVDGEATNQVAKSSLAFGEARLAGNRAVQVAQSNRIRRVLSTSIGGVFDAAGLVENRDGHRLLGREGNRIYVSFLQRVNRTNDVFYGFELNRGDGNANRVLCVGNGADGAGYGVTSNYNAYGASNYPSLGDENTEANLIVIRIDFRDDDRDEAVIFRNPKSLIDESENREVARLRGNFAFDRISLGNFEGSKTHEIDEVRVGTNYRAVTGQRDHIRNNLMHPVALLNRRAGLALNIPAEQSPRRWAANLPLVASLTK